MAVAASTDAAAPAVSWWWTVDDVAGEWSVDDELSRVLCSALSSYCSSAVPSSLLWPSVSALRLCCRSLQRMGRERRWSGPQLSSALSVALSLHRACHSQPMVDGALLCTLPTYSACRLQLLQLLLTTSVHCPPFAALTLSTADCQAVIALMEHSYFPFLHLSQLSVHRSNRLSLSSATATATADQPTLQRTDGGGGDQRSQQSVEREEVVSQRKMEVEDGVKGADDRGVRESAAEGDEVPGSGAAVVQLSDDACAGAFAAGVSLSAAAQSAVADLHVQFLAKLRPLTTQH